MRIPISRRGCLDNAHLRRTHSARSPSKPMHVELSRYAKSERLSSAPQSDVQTARAVQRLLGLFIEGVGDDLSLFSDISSIEP